MYKCVTTIEEIRDYLKDAKYIAFDFETAPDEKYRNEEYSALDPHKAHIVGVSFSREPGTGIYAPIAHKNSKYNLDLTELLRAFAQSSAIRIAHNLAFESMFLYKSGIILKPPVYDTMLAAMMTLKSNTEFRALSDSGLKTLVPQLLGVSLPSFEDVVSGAGSAFFDELDPTNAEAIRYACADSDYALQLYHLFNNWFDRFLPKHRWIVENIESPTAVFVGIMKYNGVAVDKALMYQKQFDAENKISEVKSEILKFIGRDINIGANAATDELKKYLYEDLNLPVLKTTAKYQAAADEEAFVFLKEWCGDNKPELTILFDLILQFRKWAKIKSTYIDGYLNCVNNETDRLHPNFFQLGAESGRFSCRNPNIQNQVSGGEVNVRNFIVSSNGHSLIELDYSQIEARLAAFLSRDEMLLTVFKNKQDLHAMTTAAVFGIPLSQAMDKNIPDYKHRRTVAKTTFFGFLYGIYAKSLMRNLKLSANIESTIAECKQFLQNLSTSYETLSQWQKDTISKAKNCGYAQTVLGRRRYLPEIYSPGYIKRGNAERSALNHGVQGLSADILKLAMARLIIDLPLYLKPIFTVHDSLVFECTDGKVREAVKIIKQAMETPPPINGFDVDIVAEVSVGKSYGKMEDYNNV